MGLSIRKAEIRDLPDILRLFRETIQAVNRRDYTDAQIKAWLSGAVNEEKWKLRIEEQYFILAVENEILSGTELLRGFGSVDNKGYLDLLFVHKEWQGRGVGRAIHKNLEDRTRESGISEMYTHASITARNFFEREGYTLVNEQTIYREHIALTNYRMKKLLT